MLVIQIIYSSLMKIEEDVRIMSTITKPITREIIEDFAREIDERKQRTTPSKTVINFRNELSENYERNIFSVPIGLLLFRKDNGRIASDVYDYEHRNARIDEIAEASQDLLRKFLAKKDPEKTEELSKNIQKSGQLEPAIITCDGFLIDGNRRKMVMDKLRKDFIGDSKFQYMKVVILPGKGDEGGPPTLLEIEKLENRYQLQSDGKSEYYGFDRALSIRRKVYMGLSLEEQIRDDPKYTNVPKREIQKAIKAVHKDYLNPLECIDRYLKQFKREHQYHTVSSGIGDKEGRWQAFVDYSATYYGKFYKENFRIENQIEEDEIGEIEEAAFNIIRLRKVPSIPKKVHAIMRDLHKYCGNSESKKEILSIPKKVDPVALDHNQAIDSEQGKSLSREDVDAQWSAKNIESIAFHMKRAQDFYTSQKAKETPIDLLEAALKKLQHESMDLTSISINDYRKTHKLIVDIKKEADELERKLFDQKKKLDSLKKVRGDK